MRVCICTAGSGGGYCKDHCSRIRPAGVAEKGREGEDGERLFDRGNMSSQNNVLDGVPVRFIGLMLMLCFPEGP